MMKTIMLMVIAILLGTLVWSVAVGVAYGEWGVLLVVVAGIGIANVVLTWELVRMVKVVFDSEGKVYPEMEGTVARLRQWIKEIRA